MARNITGNSLNQGVTVSNLLVPETPGSTVLMPSTVAQNIITAGSGGAVSDSNFGTRSDLINISLGAGSDTLHAHNVIWADDTSGNGFGDINMGAGNDLADLERSAVRGAINMGDGNDTLNMNNSFALNVSLGQGDDEINLNGDPDQLSQRELDAKAANINRVMNVDGGVGGSDSLNIIPGDWTIYNSSGNFSIDMNGDGTADTFTSVLPQTLLPRVISMPTVLNGTVSLGTITAPDGTTMPSRFTYSNFEDINMICFTAGTMVETPEGMVAIETLKAGDLVVTRDGVQPLRWVGKRRLDVVDLAANSKLLPVKISAGAFGNGLPKRDVSFSPQHRVVVRSAIAERMFGKPEVLAAVKQMLNAPGIEVDGSVREVTYVHLMFDRHTTINVAGIEAETLYPGIEALKSLSKDALSELRSIFSDIEAVLTGEIVHEPSIDFVKGRDARALVARHVKNAQPLYI